MKQIYFTYPTFDQFSGKHVCTCTCMYVFHVSLQILTCQIASAKWRSKQHWSQDTTASDTTVAGPLCLLGLPTFIQSKQHHTRFIHTLNKQH